MALEKAAQRLQKWKPEHVILGTHDCATMHIPEDFAHPNGLRIRLIACRNLCKRALQKCCTIDYGQHK
jgi:hypothetical protein